MKEFSGIKRTKIIATLGPAITGNLSTFAQLEDPKNSDEVVKAHHMMEQIFRKGVNTVRLNFSHGTRESQGVKLKIARDVAKKLNVPISVMLDTNGPEVRVGKLKDDLLFVNEGDLIDIYTKDKIIGENGKFSVSDSSGNYNMALDLEVDNQVLVDDGKLVLRVVNIDRSSNVVHTVALNAHRLAANKRINLPNVNYSIPFLAEKDLEDIKYGIENGIDIIAASFVNSEEDIKQVRNILKQYHASDVQLISKIESTNAIKNIDQIIQKSDGIMIARGDLALEIPYYEIPHWEKYIIKACRLLEKKCIVATQMLDSLERNVLPTRAEVTDVFYAVERGTDATMLSGETASGKYPIQAVEVMSKIDCQSEQLFDYVRSIEVYYTKTKKFHTGIGRIIWDLAKKCTPKRMLVKNTFKYNFIVIFSNDRKVIDAFSLIRFPSTIIAVTNSEKIYRGCGISYGIYPYLLANSQCKTKFCDLTQNDKKIIAKEAIDHYCDFYAADKNYSYAIFDVNHGIKM